MPGNEDRQGSKQTKIDEVEPRIEYHEKPLDVDNS